MNEKFIKTLLQIQIQFKLLHWQTESYSEHKAFGKLYDNLDGLIDDFAEIMMGKYGRFDFNSKFEMSLYDIDSIDVLNLINSGINDIILLSENLDPDYDTDLLNLKDEIMALLNKGKYLLTLK